MTADDRDEYLRHEQMLKCHDRLLHALTLAMQLRPCSEGLDWIEFERERLAAAASRWALTHRGCRLVTVEDIEAVEHRACGHVDYATKLCLYVAEMVYGYGLVACTSPREVTS